MISVNNMQGLRLHECGFVGDNKMDLVDKIHPDDEDHCFLTNL